MALELKNADIAAKAAELAAKDAEIARKDAALAAKDAWIAAKLTAKNCQILQLKYLLLEQYKTILLDQVAPLDQRLKELEQLRSTPAVFPTDMTVASFLRSFGAQRSGFLSRHAVHAALRVSDAHTRFRCWQGGPNMLSPTWQRPTMRVMTGWLTSA